MKAVIVKILIIVKTFIQTLLFLYGKFRPEIDAIVKEVEKRAIDGVIDYSDRKAIAMEAAERIAEVCGKKFGFIHKIIVGIVIDKVAQKLPKKDINVPNIIADIAKVRNAKDKKTTKTIKKGSRVNKTNRNLFL